MNGYMKYALRQVKEEHLLSSFFCDPRYPEDFCVGYVENVDNTHYLTCELTPWGVLDGWRVRRNRDLFYLECDGDYERRMTLLMNHHQQVHMPLLDRELGEQEELMLEVMRFCMEQNRYVSIFRGEEMMTGKVREVNSLRVLIESRNFLGDEVRRESLPLGEIDVLCVGTQEEEMYGILEEIDARQLRLLEAEPI